MSVSVQEAAKVLGVSPRRVLALISAGRIPAVKIGRDWFVEPGERRRRTGRPLSSANAWAILALLSDERAWWLRADVASRVKGYLKDPDMLALRLLTGAPRSQVHRIRVLSSDLKGLEEEPDLVRTGLSADPSAIALVNAPADLDAYVPVAVLDEIRRRLMPVEGSLRPNVVLRVPTHPWVLQRESAPPAVIAADLLDHKDPRVSDAALRTLEGLGR